jgi:hypothetical protein
MSLPVGAYAANPMTSATPAHPTVKQVIQHKWDQQQPDHKKRRLCHRLTLGTHRQMYLMLLAEKYTPESVDKWKAAFAERERLVAKWKAEKAGKGVRPTDKEKEAFRGVLKQFRQLHEEFDAAIESGDVAKIKAVLPKLLNEVETVNQHLANKLEEKNESR